MGFEAHNKFRARPRVISCTTIISKKGEATKNCPDFSKKKIYLKFKESQKCSHVLKNLDISIREDWFI